MGLRFGPFARNLTIDRHGLEKVTELMSEERRVQAKHIKLDREGGGKGRGAEMPTMIHLVDQLSGYSLLGLR